MVATTQQANYIVHGKFKDNITSASKKAFKNFQRAAKAAFKAVTVATLAVGASLALMVSSAQKVSIQFEQIENTLKSVAGSTEAAGKEFEFVRAESDRLGLVLQQTARDYAKLTAASKGTVLQGQATRDIFTSVNEAAVVLGLSAEQKSGALTAIEQIMSKGIVSAEELRGQLGERLPGAFQIAARAMGVTTQALGKMLEMGELTADVFLPKFSAELKKTFGEDLEAATDSALSNINRMSTAYSDFLKVIGDFINKNETVKDTIKKITETFGKLVEKFKENKEKITELVTSGVEKVKSALVAIAVGSAKAFDAIKPIFTFTLNAFNGLLDFFNNLPPIIRDIGIVGLMIGGAKIRLLILAVATITQNFEILVGWIKQAIAYVKEFLGFNDKDSALNKTLDSVRGGLEKTFSALGGDNPNSVISKVRQSFKLLGGDIADFANNVVGEVDFVKEKIVSLAEKIPSPIEAIIGGNTGTAETYVKELVQVFTKGHEEIANKAKQTFIISGEVVKTTSKTIKETTKTIEESAKKTVEEGKRLARSLRTPLEIYEEELFRLKRLLDANAITQEIYNRALGTTKSKYESATRASEKFQETIKKEIALKESLNRFDSQGIFSHRPDGSPGTIKVSGTLGNFNNKVTLQPFKSFRSLPSFASGIDRVPSDMVARIHKGEKILNEKDANKFRNSRGRVSFGNVTIKISGDNKSPKQIAREVRRELLRANERAAA